MEDIRTGDYVSKKSGYKYEGWIVADFVKTTGERRVVVQEVNSGMLHIFNPEQLEKTVYTENTCTCPTCNAIMIINNNKNNNNQ